MPRFLILANYTQEGLRGLIKEGGTARSEAVRKAVEGAGGKMECFYYAFGDNDVVSIAELPDNVTAVALNMAIGSTGLATIRVLPLMTGADIDKAAKKTIGYRGPGQPAKKAPAKKKARR